MNPIWRYTKLVERKMPRTLPGERRTRLVGSIYADLKAQADAERKRLGRDLTEGETERLLGEAGAPELLAARYLGLAAPNSLVERYLAAVERGLPARGAQDILAELRDAITGRMEIREAELDRPADRRETAVILKDFGPPTVVANRYAGRDALIGGDLAPYFWPAQRMVFGAVGAVVIILAALSVITGADAWRAAGQAFNRLVFLGLLAFAQVTLVFILLERAGLGGKIRESWDPLKLPADDVRPPKSLFDSLLNLAADVVFLLFWTAVISFPSQLAGGGEHAASLHFTDVWEGVWIAILCLGLLSAATHAADLVYPAWSRLRSIVSIVGHVGAIVTAAVLLRSGPWLKVTAGSDAEAQIDSLGTIANYLFAISLWIGALIWLVSALVEGARLARSLRR